MADTKISALTSGSPAQGADELPINRAGANFKLTLAQIIALVTFAGLSDKPTLGTAAAQDSTAFDAAGAAAAVAATLAAVATSGAYSDLTGKPALAAVATSGDYNDLANKPTPIAVSKPSASGNVGVTADLNIELVTTGAADLTRTLPAAATWTNKRVTLKKMDSGAGSVIIAGTVDGDAGGYELVNQNQYVTLLSDGTDISVIGGN